MKIINKAVLPKGFKANGIACGLKKSGKLDLALVVSDVPAKSFGLFTTNKVIAAPVVLCKEHLKKNKNFKAIIANSGNANCFNGADGLKDAKTTVKTLAKKLSVKEVEIFVGSTGIIGKRMDVKKITDSIDVLVDNLSADKIGLAEQAIMTTDKFAKELTVEFKVGNKKVRISGIAKGAGMISPKMATMLCYVMTDANISQKALEKSLKEAVEMSFNCVTVDGCMSTNDTIILMANGQADNSLINENTKEYDLFAKSLKIICLELAKMMVKDGEGATKIIQIDVKSAKTKKDANTVALAIANSNLFKTAMYGQNPNFGRIVAAAGACGVNIDPDKIKVKLGPLDQQEIKVLVDLKMGNFATTVYASDLTHEYIKINAEYN